MLMDSYITPSDQKTLILKERPTDMSMITTIKTLLKGCQNLEVTGELQSMSQVQKSTNLMIQFTPLMVSEQTEKEYHFSGLIGRRDNGSLLVLELKIKKSIIRDTNTTSNHYHGRSLLMLQVKRLISGMILSTLQKISELIEMASQSNGQTGKKASGFNLELKKSL